MSNILNLSRFKQKYRTRYCGNRVQNIPDLKPGDNALSFIKNYLKISDSDSNEEDSIVVKRSFSARRIGHLSMQQSSEKQAQDSSTKTDVDHATQLFPADWHLKTSHSSKRISLRKRGSSHKIIDYKLASDESENNQRPVVAKLIEESLAERDDHVVNKLVNNSEKPREKLYSSDTSVVQEPPSPTSNIHATKWLSFKDSTLATNNHVFTYKVPRTSEDFTNNQKLKRQEALNSNNENRNQADMSYFLAESASNGPENEFVIEDESSCNLKSWISPVKKKKASPLSTRAKKDTPTPTPKKTNPIEASSGWQKKSENVTPLLASSTRDERPENEFVIEDESSCNLKSWISPVKKKKASPLSTRAKKDTPTPTPKKTNPIEASSGWQKKSENVTASLAKSAADERPENEFVIEDESSCNLESWISPVKKKTVSPLSTRAKKDTPTPTPKKTNPIETSSSWQKKSETLTTSLVSRAKDERMVNTEKKTNDPNARKKSFSNLFFKTATAGQIGNRLSSVVSEAPATSTTVCTNVEEFEIEDLSDINESNLLTIPVKGKSTKTGFGSKREKSMPRLPKSAKDYVDSESEEFVKYVYKKQDHPPLIKNIKELVQIPPIKTVNAELSNVSTLNHKKGAAGRNKYLPPDAALLQVVEGIEKQGPLSQDTDLPRVVEGIERKESIYGDDLPGEKQDAHHTENNGLNNMKPLQPVPHVRRSQRVRDNWSAAKLYGDLEATYSIRNRAGKGNAKSRVAVEKENISKQPDKKQEEQFSKESPEIDHGNGRQTVTGVGLQSKKRANMKDVRTPCPVDGNKVFQSGPVKRQRAVQFPRRVKSLACDLDFPAKDEHVTTEDEEDESIVSSNVEFGGEVQDLTPEDKEGEIHVSSAEKEELLKRHTIVFDPDSQSNVLVECVAQSENSKFIGSDYCTTWNSFSNNIFTTGKLIIAPQKKTKRSIVVSEIVINSPSPEVALHLFQHRKNTSEEAKETLIQRLKIYYVEQGRVKLSLHESERILKDGDFFFVPPGNSWTIDNLQDKEAVLVFNFLKIHKHLA